MGTLALMSILSKIIFYIEWGFSKGLLAAKMLDTEYKVLWAKLLLRTRCHCAPPNTVLCFSPSVRQAIQWDVFADLRCNTNKKWPSNASLSFTEQLGKQTPASQKKPDNNTCNWVFTLLSQTVMDCPKFVNSKDKSSLGRVDILRSWSSLLLELIPNMKLLPDQVSLVEIQIH